MNLIVLVGKHLENYFRKLMANSSIWLTQNLSFAITSINRMTHCGATLFFPSKISSTRLDVIILKLIKWHQIGVNNLKT